MSTFALMILVVKLVNLSVKFTFYFINFEHISFAIIVLYYIIDVSVLD